MDFPPLLAWFSNPLMLWGLGAASVPILIHLLNRRRYREMPWAAMRFLLAALQKNRRRIRVEQWLLLAVRTLLVVLVVLAMARPFLESLGAIALLPGQRTHWVLVLDGSMSMDATAGGTSRFEHAKRLAAQLVRATRQGDGVSVVLMADPPRAVIGAPAFRREAVAKEIGDVTLPHGGTNLPASFAKVEEVLAGSDIPRKEVVFLTDLQAASWNRGGGADEGLKRALARLSARRARSTVIDLGAPGGSNRAVTDLRLDPPIVTPGAPVTVRAVVRNFGRQGTGDVRARLVLDGALGPEEVVALGPGEERAIAFATEFDAPGDHVAEVRIDPDVLKLDDRRRLVVPVREAVRVLLVDGDPNPEVLKSETAFLAEALNPQGGAEGEDARPVSPLATEVVGESQLAGRDLAAYDAVVLANIARFTQAEASALDAFLKQGGGVVVFGGDRVVPENYNQLLFADGKGPLPARIGATVGDPGRSEKPFEFDALGFKHPLVAPFSGESPGVTASLTNVKTVRFHRLELPKGSTAQVALAFSGGDPAIVEAPRHRGRVVLVATSADTAWTTWPLHQSFPPVMEQIALLAASGRVAERNVRVGQPIIQAFPPGAAGAEVTVRRPSGSPAPARIAPDGDVGLLQFDGTDLSGVYHAMIGSPVNREVDFAANPDPAESDPAKLDAPGLKAALPGWDFVYDSDWRPLRDAAAAVGHRGELHRPLLWGVLGLLLLESTLASLFGHHAPRRG